MEVLLGNIRCINKLFQQSDVLISLETYRAMGVLPFANLSQIISELLDANVYLLDRNRKVLGYAERYTMASERFNQLLETNCFPEGYTERLHLLTETAENLTVDELETIFPTENKELFSDGLTTIVPFFISGSRLGSMILGRVGRPFTADDLVLAEYTATLIGVELMHLVEREQRERDRENAQIAMAISSLSYSERVAVRSIFDELENLEGRVTASKVAEEKNLTRSVIVNALRKLESAGLIESQSLGMRGTYIRVLNENIFRRIQECN